MLSVFDTGIVFMVITVRHILRYGVLPMKQTELLTLLSDIAVHGADAPQAFICLPDDNHYKVGGLPRRGVYDMWDAVATAAMVSESNRVELLHLIKHGLDLPRYFKIPEAIDVDSIPGVHKRTARAYIEQGKPPRIFLPSPDFADDSGPIAHPTGFEASIRDAGDREVVGSRCHPQG